MSKTQSPRRQVARREREPHTQKRGEERRRQLIDAAAQLLQEREIDEISLNDVAAEAGIPITSTYHFYGDLHSLLAALAVRYGEEFVRLLQRPLPAAKISKWQDVLELMIARSVRYYGANPGARKLLIDGKVPADIKFADRLHDRVLGALVESTLARYFELPEFPERTRVFYHGVEIVDLMLQLSVIESRRITSAMTRHAHLACIGYLRAFLPEKLPRQSSG
jgi:AcrR family transcriptional regulator